MGNHADKDNCKPVYEVMQAQVRSTRSIKGGRRMRKNRTDLLDVEVSIKLTEPEGHHSRQGSKKSTASACVEIPISVENQQNVSDEDPESVFHVAHGSIENQETFCRTSFKRTREDSTDLVNVEVSIRLSEPERHHSRQGSKKSEQSTSRQGSKKTHKVKGIFIRQSFNRRGFKRKTKCAAKVLQKPDTLTVDGNEGNHSRQGSQRSEHEGYLQSVLMWKCNRCADVTNSTNWMKAKPSVSTEEGFPLFVQTCSSGQFECTQTGIRWVCFTDVKIQYRVVNWEVLHGIMESYEPAGPLLNITLLEGELEEIHLTHFLCLGGVEASLHDYVKVLHWRESGVSLEKCDLTRFHGRVSKPTFSFLGLIIKKFQDFLSLSVHGALVHYCAGVSPLILHTYLMPEEPILLQRVKENSANYCPIPLPRPEEPLRLGTFYQLRTSCFSDITPSEIQFRYPRIVPNFFKVRIEDPKDKFKMELIRVHDRECKWIGEFHKDEYNKTTAKRQVAILENYSPAMIENEAHFIDDHRVALIERVTCIPPIAEEMLSQGLIHKEKHSNIMAARTSEERMREIYKCLQSSGTKGKAQFYQILLLKEPHLVKHLNNSHH
ncbi:NACHT, LRR and PYD domains-containing protein 1 homolog isoform X3 [Alosa pseudoharengus]|uniref:NACHT, LRR and PYD domains-containing protein 1 homolog isoform X3 n=1 Tax=Alosa pseudoharengus TaxID=34774 RepID=UPI003F8B7B28